MILGQYGHHSEVEFVMLSGNLRGSLGDLSVWAHLYLTLLVTKPLENKR